MSIIVDVEASGLHPDSYPIEIAWFDFESGEHDSFLIKPASYWTYWDPIAESIHGIDQAELIMKGLSVFEASDRLLDRLRGRTVYSDAVPYDSMWIEALLEASGEIRTVAIDSVFSLVSDDECGDLMDRLSSTEKPHRALDDCRVIADCVFSAKKPCS